MVQLPSDDVTTVRPSELDVDMLVEPLPGRHASSPRGRRRWWSSRTRLPPPAVTDWSCCRPTLTSAGGFSPGFRCTVLQLLLGPDEDDETSAVRRRRARRAAALGVGGEGHATGQRDGAEHCGFHRESSPRVQATGRPEAAQSS